MKARLDGEYVKKIGFLMDVRCFFGTVISVLRTEGVVEGGTGVKAGQSSQLSYGVENNKEKSKSEAV